jgi:hypothetical protein
MLSTRLFLRFFSLISLRLMYAYIYIRTVYTHSHTHTHTQGRFLLTPRDSMSRDIRQAFIIILTHNCIYV